MTHVTNYTQEGYQPPENPYLDKGLYEKVLPVWVKACIDAILYVVKEGKAQMIIGKRKILPQKDWWVFGGRLFPTDLTLQDAVSRKLKEEIGIEVTTERIPREPACLNYMRWSDDSSTILAPAFIVEVTEKEIEQMIAYLPQSPEFSEIRILDPDDVLSTSEYHSVLRICAKALIQHLAH